MTTPRKGAPELSVSQASKEATHNEALRYMEQGGDYYIVADKDLTSPPGSPAVGDCYIVASGATGAWAGHDEDLAFYLSTSWNFIQPATGTLAYLQDEDEEYRYDGSSSPGSWALVIGGSGGGLLAANNLSDVSNAVTAGANIRPVESLIIAVGDETTAITTGTSKVTFRMPYAFTVTAVRGSLSTAQTSGGQVIVDVNEGGVSIISTKLLFDNGSKTTVGSSPQPVISDSSLADDAEITIDIDNVGDGTAKGLKVTLIGHRT